MHNTLLSTLVQGAVAVASLLSIFALAGLLH